MRPLREALIRAIPVCFIAGASIELFMLNTGFYDVALRKEAERREERIQRENKKNKRLRELNIKID